MTAASEYAVRLSLKFLPLMQSQIEMKKFMEKREEKMHSARAQFTKVWGGKNECSNSSPMAMMKSDSIIIAKMAVIQTKAIKY